MNAADLIEVMQMIGDTPEGVDHLRRIVLNMALRGYLAEHDLDDDSVDDLLVQLSELRGDAISEGSIKKPKPVSSLDESERPYEIPSGWRWVRLGAAALVCMGNSPPGSSYNDTGEGVPLVNGPVEFSPDPFGRTLKTKFTTQPTQICDADDLLVCVRGATTGRTNIASCAACIGRGVALVRLWDCQAFGNLFMWSVGKELLAAGKGTTFPSISYKDLAEKPFPLPPLAEQRRIVAKVDELMALLDDLERTRDERDARRAAFRDSALAALQNAEDAEAVQAAWSRIATNLADCITDPADIAPLRQTILQLAVRGRLVPQDPKDEPASELLKKIEEEKADLIRAKKIKKPKTLLQHGTDFEPFTLPAGWVWASMESLHSKLGAGSTPLGGRKVYTQNGVIFLRSQNIWNDGLRLDDAARIPVEIHERMSETHVRAGDVLLNITGASIARSCVVPGEFSTANVSQHVAIVRQVDQQTNRWIHLFLISPLGYSAIMGVQVGISREGLSMGRLREFGVPLPPLAEQRRIVARVDELMAICDELEQQLTEAKAHQSAFAAAAVHHLQIDQQNNSKQLAASE